MASRPQQIPPDPTARLLGDSPAIQVLRVQIRHLATFDTLGNPDGPTLLLQGETGTGKGLIARVMHDSGPRAAGPFLDGRRQRTGLQLRYPLISPSPTVFENTTGCAE